MIAIDTNILVYAFDSAYPKKRKICKKLITQIFEGKKEVAISNQILAEFSSAVTKKIENPLPKKDASAIIGAILTSSSWKILNYTGDTVLYALESSQNFWDALITQTLKQHNIKTIITENIKDFKNSGLKAHNPF